MAVSILKDGRFDQQALAEVYGRAYAAKVAAGHGFPMSEARNAVLDFIQLLAEDRGATAE